MACEWYRQIHLATLWRARKARLACGGRVRRRGRLPRVACDGIVSHGEGWARVLSMPCCTTAVRSVTTTFRMKRVVVSQPIVAATCAREFAKDTESWAAAVRTRVWIVRVAVTHEYYGSVRRGGRAVVFVDAKAQSSGDRQRLIDAAKAMSLQARHTRTSTD
eukprot:5903456-Prymnesium_polylepis.2